MGGVSSTQLDAQARVEIEDTLTALARAWDAGDAASFARLFTEDATYVVYFGASYVGREAIERAHIPLFQRFSRGSRMRLEIQDIRLLTPDTAVVLTEAVSAKAPGCRWTRCRRSRSSGRGAAGKCAAFRTRRRIGSSCGCSGCPSEALP